MTEADEEPAATVSFPYSTRDGTPLPVYRCPFCKQGFCEARAGSGGIHRCPACKKLLVSQDDIVAHERENPVDYDEAELGLET